MPPKPTSILILAILGIVFSTFSLLIQILVFVIPLVHPMRTDPVLLQLYANSIYIFVHVCLRLISIANNVLLLCASIGSLRLIRWCRKSMLIYAWIELGHLAARLLFTILFVYPHLSAIAAANPSLPVRTAAGALSLDACIYVIYAIFPICILYYFTRKKVIRAFHGILVANQSMFQVLIPPQQNAENQPRSGDRQ